MLPTMALSGEWVIERALRPSSPIARGDLVTFTSPSDPSRTACKRVLGLPGDVVCVDPLVSDEHVVVPRNHLWLAGDNRALSRDSRTYGPVPVRLVRGRLVARVRVFYCCVMPWRGLLKLCFYSLVDLAMEGPDDLQEQLHLHRLILQLFSKVT